MVGPKKEKNYLLNAFGSFSVFSVFASCTGAYLWGSTVSARLGVPLTSSRMSMWFSQEENAMIKKTKSKKLNNFIVFFFKF